MGCDYMDFSIYINIMRQCICILILATLIFFRCGQEKKYPYESSDFKPELKNHLDKIVATGQLLNDPDTLTRNFFKDSCTKEELLKLLNFENPLVRVMAYGAIVNRNESDCFSILLNHLDDTTKVTWWYFDDAANDFMVSDLMIEKIAYGRKLTQYQKDRLVDEVLFKHNYLGTVKSMIQDIQPKEKYYSVIRVAAQKALNSCHDLSNSYSLAKFKKQKDIPLIKKNFSEYTENSYCNNNYFKAIEVFPDTAFFPVLTKYFDLVIKRKKQQYADDLKFYTRAVAQYKSQSSLKILTNLTKKEIYPDSWYFSYNQEYIFKAIHKYNSPIYDELYQTLRLKMDSTVIKHLEKPDYNERLNW